MLVYIAHGLGHLDTLRRYLKIAESIGSSDRCLSVYSILFVDLSALHGSQTFILS
jgi:hypothetical protein